MLFSVWLSKKDYFYLIYFESLLGMEALEGGLGGEGIEMWNRMDGVVGLNKVFLGMMVF